MTLNTDILPDFHRNNSALIIVGGCAATTSTSSVLSANWTRKNTSPSSVKESARSTTFPRQALIRGLLARHGLLGFLGSVNFGTITSACFSSHSDDAMEYFGKAHSGASPS